MLQGFLYFMWYQNDDWSIKATVAAMLVVESVQMGAAFANVYQWLISNFGNFDNLGIIHWQDMFQLTALYISTFIAQAHFARTIYQLHRKNIILPVTILVLSLVALGCGMAQVGSIVGIDRYEQLGSTSDTTNTQAAFSLAADMLITFGLCWRLTKSRTGIQSTNNVLNFLIMTTINRGVFTMMFAVLNIILFLSQPGTFYFMLALLLSDKFYMNSMLAILNTRQHAFKMYGTEVEMSMPTTATPRKTTAVNMSTAGNTTQLSDMKFAEVA